MPSRIHRTVFYGTCSREKGASWSCRLASVQTSVKRHGGCTGLGYRAYSPRLQSAQMITAWLSLVHETPLELALELDRKSAKVRILEYVDGSDRARTLGTLIISRNHLFLTVAEIADRFARQLASANPSLAQNSALLLFKRQAERLREQVSYHPRLRCPVQSIS